MVDQNKELLYYGIRNGRLVPIRSIEESIPGEDQYDIDGNMTLMGEVGQRLGGFDPTTGYSLSARFDDEGIPYMTDEHTGQRIPSGMQGGVPRYVGKGIPGAYIPPPILGPSPSEPRGEFYIPSPTSNETEGYFQPPIAPLQPFITSRNDNFGDEFANTRPTMAQPQNRTRPAPSHDSTLGEGSNYKSNQRMTKRNAVDHRRVLTKSHSRPTSRRKNPNASTYR